MSLHHCEQTTPIESGHQVTLIELRVACFNKRKKRTPVTFDLRPPHVGFRAEFLIVPEPILLFTDL